MDTKLKKIALLHTVHQIIPSLHKLCIELLPDIIPIHLLNENILYDLIEYGELNQSIYNKVNQMMDIAYEANVSLIMVTCSSIAPCINHNRYADNMPILRIDQPMAVEACIKGVKIAVVATLAVTLKSTMDNINLQASKLKKYVNVKSFICHGAFQALQEHKIEEHDMIIERMILEASEWADVIVLAQSSMSNIVSRLKMNLRQDILTSSYSGILQLKEFFSNNKQDQ